MGPEGVDASAPKKWEGAVEIEIDLIEPDPQNANTMSPQTLQALILGIQQEGFDEPIQIAPLLDEKTGERKKTADGKEKYVIIGGEHRWRGAKILEMKTIPAVIKPVTDIVSRRMAMIRRNLVRGELDRTKFTSLVKDLERRKAISADVMAQQMGFSSDKHFKQFFKDEKARGDSKIQAAIEDARKDMQLSDSLAHVLSEILGKWGATMPAGWVFFAHKSRLHLMLQMEPELYKAVQILCAWAKRDGKLLQEVLDSAIRNELKRWGVDADEFSMGETDLKDELPPEGLPEEPSETPAAPVEEPVVGQESGEVREMPPETPAPPVEA